MISFEEALRRASAPSSARPPVPAPIPRNSKELTAVGIHYGTVASSKYAKKRGNKPTMRNKQKANFSTNISRYRAEKIATASLTTRTIEPTTQATNPTNLTQVAPTTSLDYRNLPKYLLTDL